MQVVHSSCNVEHNLKLQFNSEFLGLGLNHAKKRLVYTELLNNTVV